MKYLIESKVNHPRIGRKEGRKVYSIESTVD